MKKTSSFNEAKPRTPKGEAHQREMKVKRAMEELVEVGMKTSSSGGSPNGSVSCPAIRNMKRRWLLGGSCAAGSLELPYIFYERFSASVLLSFREPHLFHLLFEKPGKRFKSLLAGSLLTSLGSRSWKRRHLVALSVHPLRHDSLLQTNFYS
jgi:hypothetical protein